MGKANKNDLEKLKIETEKLKNHTFSLKYSSSDFGTVAYSIPRNEIRDEFEEEALLKYGCIYFLIGKENGKEKVYVGKSTVRNNGISVLQRLREHNDSKTESYKDIWEYAVVLTNKEDKWEATELGVLEYLLYNEIPNNNRLNNNTPCAGLSFDKIEQFKEKIRQAILLSASIGVKTFEPSEEDEKKLQIEEVISESIERLTRRKSKPEIMTPRSIVKAMVDKLDNTVWNSKTKFIDLACKGGEYLREIYDRLMITESIKAEFPNEIERSNHICKNQIYGIALSDVSYDRTKKALLGGNDNIKKIYDLCDRLKDKNINEIIKEAFGTDMTFDVVIGNPPYQDNTASIYPHFINAGLELADKVCMITRNNWLVSNTLKDIRNKMINAGIVEITNYPKIGEVFRGLSVAVSIFNIDKANYKGVTEYKEICDKQLYYQYNRTFTNNSIIFRNDFENSIYTKIKLSLTNGIVNQLDKWIKTW